MKYKRVNRKAHQKVEMGNCSEWPLQDGFCPNGLVVEDAASITRPLEPRRWAKAEERTAELISRIQPNRLSEMRRRAVASYVQRLISKCIPCQVFTFGSVPLKTYLPDGDIDLTTFSEDQNSTDSWAKEVQHMLQMEEKNEHAEFSVKEVQLIHAEVKIIKCLVDNIVVDISFNQLGGLCTLCFLEEVDNLISQNYLFKRSIILVKAWCYYESRVLGAHHGLISTYALETLVLYIFHVFNNSFTGPLEVLYRFLEFFSKFDWANFCVSLWGPVPISALPNMTADPPRKDGGDLLLSKMFLDSCDTAYSVFPVGSDKREIPFTSKHFNVVDPLRLNNNLGRSVSKGNFYRIRSAFSLGAQQLAEILECPAGEIVPKLNEFFINTWDRHGKGFRPDAPILDISCHEPEVSESHYSLTDSVQLNACRYPTTRATNFHKELSAPKQKDNDESRSHMASERSRLWQKQHDDIKRTCRMNIVQTNGHTTHHFARTSSSPELRGMSGEAVSTRRNVTVIKVGDDTSSRSGSSRRVMDLGPGENLVAYHFSEEPSIRESSSRHSLSSGSDHSSGSCVSKPVSRPTTPGVSSAHESIQRCIEEQDFVNKLSFTGTQPHLGQAQMPVNLATHSFLPLPPHIMRYGHPNLAATYSTNLSAVDSDRGTVMNYSNGPFSTPFHQQFRPLRVIAEHDKMFRGVIERVVPVDVDHVDEHSSFWMDRNDHFNGEFDPGSEDYSTASSSFLPASPSASSRTEGSWDGKPSNLTIPTRYPVRKNSSSTRDSGNTASNRWEKEGGQVDHNCEESVSQSVATSYTEVNQIPPFEQPHMFYQNSMSSYGSLPTHSGPHHGAVNNPALFPVAFYPPGPHVPFVTMVPIYNIPAETGSSGAPGGHNNLERGTPQYPITHFGLSSNPAYRQEQLSHTNLYDSKNMIASGEHVVECGSDIFNSDFSDHYKNLQYGRFCQGLQLRHPSDYPSSAIVAPVSSQGTSSVVSPGRSDTFAHAVSVSASQPGPGQPAGVSRRYGGQVPKQRNGTGTYFPDPNIIKERECSTTRHYRANYGHDKNEIHEDREANWNFNSKPRYNGRAHPRSYYEKQNTKIDRPASSVFQTNRT